MLAAVAATAAALVGGVALVVWCWWVATDLIHRLFTRVAQKQVRIASTVWKRRFDSDLGRLCTAGWWCWGHDGYVCLHVRVRVYRGCVRVFMCGLGVCSWLCSCALLCVCVCVCVCVCMGVVARACVTRLVIGEDRVKVERTSRATRTLFVLSFLPLILLPHGDLCPRPTAVGPSDRCHAIYR